MIAPHPLAAVTHSGVVTSPQVLDHDMTTVSAKRGSPAPGLSPRQDAGVCSRESLNLQMLLKNKAKRAKNRERERGEVIPGDVIRTPGFCHAWTQIISVTAPFYAQSSLNGFLPLKTEKL